MATRAKFARLANYLRKFGTVSHIFSKMAFGECWRAWRILSKRLGKCWRMLASLAYFRKMPFWQMRVLVKSAEILPSTRTCKICAQVANA
jgi:hypothetical protein